VPEAVVNGFTIGIAVVIATSQLKDLTGITADHVPADFIPKMATLWDARASASWAALGAGALALAAIVLLRRLAPRLPGPLIAVGLVSIAAALLAWPVATIESQYGALPRGLPLPSLPAVTGSRVAELMPSAFVIAFLAAIESLLSAMVADRMIGGSHRPNAEVLAQGWANIGSALFGGLPATGAIARTATNVRAGGKTPVAGIVHAATILLISVVGAGLAGYLTMPALAGLLIVTAWLMSEPSRWRERMRLRPADKALFVVTLVLTVASNLTVAIAVGTFAGLALRLLRRDVEPAEWTPADRSKL
jgi:SulP family sulfate permease